MNNLPQLLGYVLLWLAILAVFFWLVLRPQKRRIAEHKELVENLQRGDRVVTAGGIHGEIVALQETTVTLEVARGVQIRLERRAVRRRYGDGDGSG